MNSELLKNIIARLKEPSTYASLAALLGAAGFSLDPGLLQVISYIGMGLAGLAGILMQEKTKTTTIVVAPPMPPPAK